MTLAYGIYTPFFFFTWNKCLLNSFYSWWLCARLYQMITHFCKPLHSSHPHHYVLRESRKQYLKIHERPNLKGKGQSCSWFALHENCPPTPQFICCTFKSITTVQCKLPADFFALLMYVTLKSQLFMVRYPSNFHKANWRYSCKFKFLELYPTVLTPSIYPVGLINLYSLIKLLYNFVVTQAVGIFLC